MDTEQRSSSDISVALSCPGQSYRGRWGWLLRWKKFLLSLLPFSCGWERILCGLGSPAPFLLPSRGKCWQRVWELWCHPSASTLWDCTQPHVVPKDKGTGCCCLGSPHGCSLSPFPKERQCKSTDPFFPLGLRILSALCTGRGCTPKLCLGLF